MKRNNLARLLALIHQKKMQKQKYRDERSQPIIIYVENEAEKYNSKEFLDENYFDWLAPDTDKEEMEEVSHLVEKGIDYATMGRSAEKFQYGDVVSLLSYENGGMRIVWRVENPEDAYHFPNGEVQILAELTHD